MIAVVLDVAPDEYQAVMASEQSKRGNDLTLLDLEVIMHQNWRQLNRKKIVRNEDNEVLLNAFAGNFFHCGRKGHRANKCPSRNKKVPEMKRNQKFCINCNKLGHLAKDCWFKESNKSKHTPVFQKSC